MSLRRSLRPGGPSGPEPPPPLLAVVTLLLLLLPFLLLTTSPHQLAGLGLLFSQEEGAGGPRPGTGAVEELELHLEGAALLLRARIRTADVTAGEGDATWNEQRIPPREGAPDLAALQRALRALKRLDPSREGLRLFPDAETRSSRLVAVVDAVRGPEDAPLFPDVELELEP